MLGNTAHNLADAGSEQMVIVPFSELITADCGQVGHVADDACNVQVQKYDAFAMAGLFLLICLVRLVGFGSIVFAIGCVTLN